MLLRTLRFITLMLAALGLTMGATHALELPPRMNYDARLYMQITSTLYRLYGLVGGPVQVAAVLVAAVLSFMVRDRPSFRLTLLGTLALGLSLGLWFTLVQPVNAAWLQALQTSPKPEVVDLYRQLRGRWEYGHLAAFSAWLCGFSLLLLSVIMETQKGGKP